MSLRALPQQHYENGNFNNDFLNPAAGHPSTTSPLTQSGYYVRPGTGIESDVNSSNYAAGNDSRLRRSDSTSSTKIESNNNGPFRAGTLKKKQSLRKTSNVKRSPSRKTFRTGIMKATGQDGIDFNSIFYTPVPTSGNPTDVLANRFQAWRKLLKDLIIYFREIQSSYEHRSKALVKVSNVINNMNTPSLFLSEGGLDDATHILRGFHKQSQNEANKAKDMVTDVINQLSGLRSDLGQKIKEIKSLSGDFKNSVDKEKDGTRRAVAAYESALTSAESDPSAAASKGDPFIARLAVDRQVEKQIEEENYLHRAYLNLEGSGRELESIVVGEIQKAYNAYAGVLKREADAAHETVEELRSGPIAMPKDHEWTNFVENDPHFINPNIPLRRIEDMQYPGQHDPAATEIRGGMLERKSKYLKSYTPGWYVLSPTHLHEFKSADHIRTQTPVMSLYLPDQKLGSRSQDSGTSYKFSLKGRQTGSMHRGHSWVFRAESYDTMVAWYDDIKTLTETTGEEKAMFVRRHARSVSRRSQKAMSMSSEGLDEDEADAVPFSAQASSKEAVLEVPPNRPEPGGRFPSDLNVNSRLQAPLSLSSGSSANDRDSIIAAAALPTSKHASEVPQHEEPVQYYGQFAHTSGRTIAPASTTLSPQDNVRNMPEYEFPYLQTPPQLSSPHTMSSLENQSQDITPPDRVVRCTAEGNVSTEAYWRDQEQAQGYQQLHLAQPVESMQGRNAELPARIKGPYVRPGSRTEPTTVESSNGDMAERSTNALRANGIGSIEATNGNGATDVLDSARDGTAEYLHQTGHIFPSVRRHDTMFSVSELHMPGEFPATSPVKVNDTYGETILG